MSSSAKTESSSAQAPRLLFVRHGETDWNAEGRLQGQRDTPLNVRGQRQAQRCGVILRELFTRERSSYSDFDFVASPLQRATETMRILRRALELPEDAFRTDPRVKELTFGRWEGFTFRELRVGHAAAVAERERDKWGFEPPEGESYEMLAARIAPWYRDLSGPCVVVSHGGVLRALFKILGIASAERAPSIDIVQGTVYDIAPGRVTHLR